MKPRSTLVTITLLCLAIVLPTGGALSQEKQHVSFKVPPEASKAFCANSSSRRRVVHVLGCGGSGIPPCIAVPLRGQGHDVMPAPITPPPASMIAQTAEAAPPMVAE